MGGTCGLHERDEMGIHSCGSKNRSKETSCKTTVCIAGQY